MSMVQSQEQPWLCRQRAEDLVLSLDPVLLEEEEEEVGAFVQSLCGLWPILTLCGDMLFSESLWVLRSCLLRVVFSLF